VLAYAGGVGERLTVIGPAEEENEDGVGDVGRRHLCRAAVGVDRIRRRRVDPWTGK
jgi:hypothetical protein